MGTKEIKKEGRIYAVKEHFRPWIIVKVPKPQIMNALW